MTLKAILAALAATLLFLTGSAQAANSEACKAVRFSDVGWTDVTSTTALASVVLDGLGYEPDIKVLSVPVTYTSLANGDIDVFLGNWMPTMTANITPYLNDGTVVQLKEPNLEGAGYGLVVPSYVAEAGVTDLKQVGDYADKFDHKIYGIEPGNDGNRLVLAMIKDPKNNLEGFELVESSEQGMLTAAKRAIEDKEWIVFLGWTPHPVMGKMDLYYLSGMGDSGFGKATVYTNVRAGYLEQCPNVGKFLTNLKFNLQMEGAIMDAILSDGQDAKDAATAWLKAHPAVLADWLDGVTTIKGEDGLAAVEKALGVSS